MSLPTPHSLLDYFLSLCQSNDMMFFLISPLYLLAYKWRPLVGVAAIVATITASVIATTVYSAKEDIFSLIDLSGTKNWGNSDVMYIRWVFMW
jgi:hypothetical protein